MTNQKGTSSSQARAKIIIVLIIGIVLFPAAALGVNDNGVTLFLLPCSDSYSVGEIFSVSVKLYTGGTAINAAEAFLEFSAKKLKVKEISFENSIFDVWPSEPFYSNEEGFISFSGGLPTPGFNDSSGTILTIFFEAKKEGQAAVNFSQARVLANDGLGTNVLENTIGGFYFYEEKPKALLDLVVTIPEDFEKIKAGDYLEIDHKVINLMVEPESKAEVEISLAYSIRDQGNVILFKDQEKRIIVGAGDSFKKIFKIPSNLKPEHYQFQTEITYDVNRTVTAGDDFWVIGKITWLLMKFWILILAVIGLGTAIAYVVFRFFRKIKK